MKPRFVVLRRAGKAGVLAHLRYIERDGVRRNGQRAQAYSAETDVADLKAFEARGRGDRHQFRLIVSPEDAAELDDLRGFTRRLMQQMATDLETPLDWVLPGKQCSRCCSAGWLQQLMRQRQPQLLTLPGFGRSRACFAVSVR